MFTSFSLPIIFTEGAYKNMIYKGHYFWFAYFILLFLLTIYILTKKNYFELVNAKIQNEKLIYKNLLIFKKEIKLNEIKGFKNGIGDDSNDYISLYNYKNKKIATLKTNIYSNLPNFLNALKCENIGIELINFQKIIQKFKNLITIRKE
jgi:hypothetical protein